MLRSAAPQAIGGDIRIARSRIRSLDRACARRVDCDWIVFTSVNAVDLRHAGVWANTKGDVRD